jgi:geranylgeranyl diphosphate synthase type II
MSDGSRVERALADCLATLEAPTTPPRLRQAIVDAVMPGGSRLRPRLSLAVAEACGDPHPQLTATAAASVELLHCASLVHDDLPCFDDAPLRRGRPSVHANHGQEMAVLAGDGLIVMAFDNVGRQSARWSRYVGPLVQTFAQAAGAVRGLVSGQAWESEASVGLRSYHQAKTAALFEAAARVGAIAADADPEPWATFGLRIGEAYQVFDDLRDTGNARELLDKPMGQDEAHGRPNAALALGVTAAVQRLQNLLAEAVRSLPGCQNPLVIDDWVSRFNGRLLPAIAAHVGLEPEAPELLLTAGLGSRR